MSSNKKRLDILLVEQGLSESREKAKATIMSGLVYVNGIKTDKSGTFVSEEAKLEIRGSPLKYVSRGGLKLEKAILDFGLSLDNKCAMDVGASTGGFSDCMLQNGARKIYAVDVGYGQLAWQIRNDPRVVVMERTNIRHVTPEDIDEPLDFCSIDVSFISLKLVLPVVHGLLRPGGEVVCLIKPQFEAGRENVGKKGVVRDPMVHCQVLENFLQYAASAGFRVLNLSFSPVKGPEGNIEYLSYLRALEEAESADFQAAFSISELVKQSHAVLDHDARGENRVDRPGIALFQLY